MSTRDSRLWLGILSALAVVWLLHRDVVEQGRASPGPLTATHAQVDELLGPESCHACHGAIGGNMASACAECHAAVSEGIELGTGFHGTLAAAGVETDARACERCHHEHLGDGRSLVTAASFALAGVADRESYDHATLDFTLGGRHLELECSECHAAADLEPLPAGTPRFLGLEKRCASCHEDVHEGRIVRDCASCHGQEHPFAEVVAFEHGAAFRQVGRHLEPDCVTCHEPGSARSVESLAGAGPPPAARDCADCHDSPHDADFVAEAARLAGLADLTGVAGCASCHDPADDDFAGHEEAMPARLHAATGFPLVEGHAGLDCAACHAPDPGADWATRFPGRARADCSACHDDPHGGEFDAPDGTPASCASCHAGARFTPSSFDLADHADTAFPLRGAHREVACAACHEEPLGAAAAPARAIAFEGTPTACDACHEDPHAGQFDADLAAGGSCATCHDERAFLPPLFDLAAHERTGFPLTGSHRAVGCNDCHLVPAQPAAAPRRFHGTDRACAACHEDAHRGAFDSLVDLQDVPDSEETGVDCARCHVTTLFAEVPEGAFDHDRCTRFPLDGAHAEADCAACHRNSARPDALGRSFGFAAELFGTPVTECATCHDDPHGGGFDRPGLPADVEGRTGCARCHDTRSFAWDEPARFDHERWTGYALEAEHAALDCASCHAPQAVPGGDGRSFGRARGTGCADCHADPHVGQFAVAGRTDCARCHADSLELLFDHDRDARFALDERHDDLECSACHRPWPLPGGGTAVRYKPLGTACGDCHGFEGDG